MKLGRELGLDDRLLEDLGMASSIGIPLLRSIETGSGSATPTLTRGVSKRMTRPLVQPRTEQEHRKKRPDIYLVTGGAGFIGSHVVRAILMAGGTVRVLDNFSTGRRSNLDAVSEQIEIIEGDVRDREIVCNAMSGAHYVIHQAAQVSAPQSVEDPLTTHEINVTGTLNVLLAAKFAGVKRVVLASSCAVYGDTDKIPTSEAVPPAPLSPYAASKLAAENYARLFNRLYGLQTVSLRYFNVFGPRQSPDSQYAAAIPKFIKAMLSGTRPVVFGDGNQTRDFVYVGDVANANLLACRVPDAAGGVYNVGSGVSTSVNELLELLGAIIGKPPDPIYTDERPGDVRHSRGDIALAKKVLGFRPAVSFEDGLRHTFNWFAGGNVS